MMHALAIAGGGALGALLRYWVSSLTFAVMGREFPWGTLLVNLVGSLAIGFLYVLLLERLAISAELRAFLLIGLLGAFTTFSTFSLETLVLMQQAEYLKAILNVLISVVGCVLLTAVGMMLGRQL
ncbi:MAG: fluoride efflux transporter CrcB [bacterium]